MAARTTPARDGGPVIRSSAAGLALLAVLILVPVFGSAYTVQLATDILTFTALAYGWNLISGFTGYLSFGQVSFYGIGGYATGLLVSHTPMPWYFAVCIGGGLAVLLALLLGPILLRVRGILFALSMLGLGRVLMVVFSDWDYAGGGNGMTLPAILEPYAIYAGAALVALLGLALNWWFARSGFGLDTMSIREDESAA
ncbi:MAG: ABC transporter permease subunit, partial [Xanthobacteraceae bacterium]